MSDAIELSASTRRLIVYGILSYFGLFAYATLAESEPAAAAAEVAFGLVAVGIGAVLYREADGATVVSGAAGCLIAGGVLQFVHLATRLVVVDLASTLLIYAGIGLYAYATLRG
ncbi:hypothetical protein [Natronococcus jeotgali]|uniref:Uncharacterized protein n=1 Tax=Natronococcus jeotgali DSM 18795 TaxID=1227498 RepID=L9WTF4_9EURY|nr:hypothetical protein [Natronococcus jeotgali]ELY51603.1 hypothetical protein C492_21030 [Natronococcus jeotgali DSM 18795]